MKTQLFCLLMIFSATALAEPSTSHDEEWEGASMQVNQEKVSKNHNNQEHAVELELSNPWYYGREESDAVVNRDRSHVYYD